MSTQTPPIEDYLQLYTNPDNSINKPALYQFISQTFDKHRKWADYLLTSPDNTTHWKNLHDYIISNTKSDDHPWQIGWQNLQNLIEQLDGWFNDHVAEPATFDFSIKQKAVEIGSGDENYDYYMALTIRHDQLLAAVQTFSISLQHLAWIVECPDAKEIVDSQHFQYFINNDTESRIFQLAEQMYHLRKQQWE